MMDAPYVPPRWKIDATGSEWTYKQFAVYKSFRLFGGHVFWWPVHYASTYEDAEEYVKTVSRLPRYFS